MKKISLRKKAEETIKARGNKYASLSSEQLQLLVHELQVHEIELELQNEALRETQEALESSRMQIELSRNRYVDLYDFSPLAYLTIDATGKIIEANLSTEKLLGMTRNALLKKSLTHFMRREEADHLYLGLQEIKERGSLELRMHRNDDTSFYGHLEILSIPGEGNEKQYRVALQDITQRKQAEENLQIAARIFETSPAGITITDADGNIIRTNRAFTTVTGYSQKEVIGKNSRLLKSDRQDKQFYQKMWQKLTESGIWEGEICNRRKNGELYIEWLSITTLRGRDNKVSHHIGSFYDITLRKRNEEKVQYLAHFDSLTGLPNRTLFNDELSRRVARTAQNHQHLALLYLDFDHFKEINDELGHPEGDHFLQNAAQRIKQCMRPSDLLARLSGDEFCIIVSALDDQSLVLHVVSQITEKIVEALRFPMELEGGTVTQSVSIGIAIYPQDAEKIADLVKYADLAMYEAKQQEGGAYIFFSREMNRNLMHQLNLKKDLKSAFKSDEFFLCYQPQIDFQGRIRGFEALLRWKHPKKGILRPSSFIDVLEAMDLINDIGQWALRTACAQASRWRQQGLKDFKVAVNLSPHQLMKDTLPSVIDKALHDNGLDGKYLELEITESLMIKDPSRAARLLEEITGQGIEIALDDFGTGYSSLIYLRRFPIKTIKIDQSFVRDITRDENDAILVKTIISMGKNLGMHIVAEGVETEAQKDFLRKNSCEILQGHYYAKPMPEEAINQWIAERQTWPE